MAHIAIARGGVLDVFFNLLTQAGGSLTDDQDWVDGTTAGQWPSVTILTQGNSPQDVTSLVARDITSDTITGATHKHPIGTTGLWRRGIGQYAFRAQPSQSLALGNYDMVVTYDVGGAPFQVVHTIEIVASGDVDFGGGSIYCTAVEVTDNFEIADIVTSAEVDKARTRADLMVHTYLQAESITTPYPTVLAGLKMAAIAFARAELRRLKAGATGLGVGLRRLTEADVTYDFVSGDSQFKALHEEGATYMDMAIRAILGSVYFDISTVGIPARERR